ncbi:MAG: hypothetical protein CL623_01420 [Arcobacter sp.]|nr:hypothetical protein [Arcobacter sp.]
MENTKCKLCGSDAKIKTTFEKTNLDCTHCKKIIFMHNTYDDLDLNDNMNFYKVSSYSYEQNVKFKNIPKIDEIKLQEILNNRDKKIKEKFDLMMTYLSSIDAHSIRNTDELQLQSLIKDDREFFILYQKAIDYGLVSGNCTRTLDGSGSFSFNELTFDGLEYVESLEHVNQNSKNIFVAFNFEDSLKDIFNVSLKAEIEKEGFSYVVVNQDNVDHNKSINDEIIVKLKSSRIVIADFTNHRNSVYFEAGYAMGMNIPIIWTCQEGHEDEMSFDTRQFPHILWKDENDLAKQVIDRIKVIL